MLQNQRQVSENNFDHSDWLLEFAILIGLFENQSKRLITYMLIVFIWMLAIAATYPIYESTVYRVRNFYDPIFDINMTQK